MTCFPRSIATFVVLASCLAATHADAQDRGPVGTVTLSRIDYDQLIDLAGRQPVSSAGAPVAAALTRTDARVRVTGATVRATMTVDGEVFHSGVVKVPLISQATLLDVRSGDRPLPLLAEGNAHVAVISGPAAFSATLEWGTTVTASPGRGSFTMPVPPAGSATATFDVPGEQSDLRVSPGLVVGRTSAGGRSTIEATLVPGVPTTVSWTSREAGQSAAAARDTRLLSDIKTLVTIGDADVRLLAFIDVTVVQGEPASLEVRLPAGYELVGANGSSLERTELQADRIALFVTPQSRRRHQFLLTLERSTSGSVSGARTWRLDTTFPTVSASQRETGEIAIEGTGTLEIAAPEIAGLRRMDVRETDASLVAAATQSLLSAYRYQRAPAGPPTLALNVTRFPDAAVLAAVAERAVATTLVTKGGRALTEVTLSVRNRAQPFMKVVLPAGASMLSVEIAGAPAKPADGIDGVRVPLLRPGFRPTGTYSVSFVYLNAGASFAKKGDMQMVLPRMDVPVSIVEWELFLPGEYRADRFGGSAIAAHLIDESIAVTGVVDTINESVDVAAVSGRNAAKAQTRQMNDAREQDPARNAPSVNVQSLQRRAAGVLPVRIEIPRAGVSHRFVKPLVVDEETIVTFRYRQR